MFPSYRVHYDHPGKSVKLIIVVSCEKTAGRHQEETGRVDEFLLSVGIFRMDFIVDLDIHTLVEDISSDKSTIMNSAARKSENSLQ